MQLGRPAEARNAFDLALKRTPNRARSIFGAASAAAQAGDSAAARKLYAQYLAQMARGDGTRAELVTARQFAGAR